MITLENHLIFTILVLHQERRGLIKMFVGLTHSSPTLLFVLEIYWTIYFTMGHCNVIAMVLIAEKGLKHYNPEMIFFIFTHINIPLQSLRDAEHRLQARVLSEISNKKLKGILANSSLVLTALMSSWRSWEMLLNSKCMDICSF